jgi:hypothetical protein
MFLHEKSGVCKFGKCTNDLSQFEHNQEVDEDMDDVEVDETEDDLVENQYHFCMKCLENQDNLFEHFEMDHNKFYCTMMASFSENKTE